MGQRHPNHRLIKIHQSYAVEEIARVLKVHKQSVRNWLKAGLATIDRGRPALVRGTVLVEFLRARRQKAKRPCPPGYLYCLRCREPRRPAEGMVEYIALSNSSGNLRALCESCGLLMHRRIAMALAEQFCRQVDMTFTQARRHIGDSRSASVNCHSNRGS